LEPAQPNVGAIYQDYLAHPLLVTATAQTYDCPPPAGVNFSWPPGTIVGEETVFTASVTGGQLPFTYTWGFGDDGTIALGNPVSHTFEVSGTFPVTLTVDNACGAADPVSQLVTALNVDEDDAYLVYLPLLLKERP
jgi:PKD repeat protein